MRQALSLGINVFDTANIYGQGDSERMIGQALAGRRDDIFVVTKFGKRFSPLMRAIRPLKPILKPLARTARVGARVAASREPAMREDFSSGGLIKALDGSLRRLGFDHIDAVLLHSPPPAILRDPEIGALLADLKRSGKVTQFGASCDDWDSLSAAMDIQGLTILQLPLDVIDRASREGMGEVWKARAVTVFAREVLGHQPGLSPVEAVRAAAARAEVDCVIVGTSRPDHLAELAGALG
jgi:aryl-alcohol dehydrogenase-like predicted oxidoreductase